MNEYYQQSRGEMLPFISSRDIGRMLDVGCGQGGFASLLKKCMTVEIWGIEPVAEQAVKAEQVLDKVICGGFDEVYDQLPKKGFDCILFNDVLEHIVDPEDVLEKVKILLRNDGMIVCSIPNVRYFPNLWELLIKRDWRYCDYGILDRTHLRFFTEKSIRRMFNECGYAEKVITGINPFKSKRMWLPYVVANIATLGMFRDTRYQQFACVMALPIDGK